jgi:hypothetical protein
MERRVSAWVVTMDSKGVRSAPYGVMRCGLTLLCSLAIFFVADAAAAASAQRPEIVPRSAWGAKPPSMSLMQPQTPRAIVIHHTAEKQQPQQTIAEKLQKLQKFSQAKGNVGGAPKPAWGDVPYHFYIDAGGQIAEGRDINLAGDSNTRYDTADRIQIVLEGHFDQEQPTAGQLRSLDRLVVWLADRYRVPARRITGHNDHVATTDCPGRNLKSYLTQLRRKVASARVVR